MSNTIGASNQAYYSPSASQQQGTPAAGKPRTEELTTVTTHCKEDHKHTPACPHTTSTRPVGSAERKGQFVDVFV